MKSWLLFSLTLLVLFAAPDAQAATYFVKPDGNDALDGLSDATAWKTLSKANSVLYNTTGHSVYFKCGGVWSVSGNSFLYITASGTPASPITIGAYYIDNGVVKFGVNANSKPVINGNNSAPNNVWLGLITLDKNQLGKDPAYIVIRDLKIINSAGFGILGGATDIVADNVETDNTKMSGIQFLRSKNSEIRNCSVNKACNCWPTRTCPDNIWPFALGFLSSPRDNVIKNNIVTNSWGEGIGVYHSPSNILIENNTVYNAMAVGIYLEGRSTYNTVRSNLVYCTSDPTYWRFTSTPGDGIGIDDEVGLWQGDTSHHNYFYGNLVSGCRTGFFSWNSHPLSIFKDSTVYNNTLVDNKMNFEFGSRAENSYVRNNISLCLTTTGTWPCTHTGMPKPLPGLTFEFNNWSSTPTPGSSGYGDVIGIPSLNKSSGWRAVQANGLTGQEFALKENAQPMPGQALNSSFARIPACKQCNWPAQTIATSDQSSKGWVIGACLDAQPAGSLVPPDTLQISIR